MKLNVFHIPMDYHDLLIAKLRRVGAEALATVEQDGWTGTFYFPSKVSGVTIPWLEPYEHFFKGRPVPQNRSYYAAFVFVRNGRCYAISHGKAHFYLRPFSDFDFGVELAKRIADEDEIRQTSSKRFAGRRKKDIRTYAPNTQLSVESGESVDFLQAICIPEARENFGRTGKFGTSAQISPDVSIDQIGATLSRVDEEVRKDARFRLPRTTVLTDDETIQRYDRQLLDEILSDRNNTEFVQNAYDLYGVDFVFSDEGRYSYRCPGFEQRDVDIPSLGSLREYIAEREIPRDTVPSNQTRTQSRRPANLLHRLEK